MCCGTFGEGCHCVLSFFTVQHQNSSGQGIPYLVSIMRETWLESRDLHVLSLLRSRSGPGDSNTGPAVLGGGALRAWRGPCSLVPSRIHSGPCFFQHHPWFQLIPQSWFPSIPSSHKQGLSSIILILWKKSSRVSLCCESRAREGKEEAALTEQ